MYRLILGNWKLALIWAVGICISTALFFARGGEEQLADSAAPVIAIEPSLVEASTVPPEDIASEDYEEDPGWGDSTSR